MLTLVVILVLLGGLALAVLLWAGGGKTIHEPHGSGIIEAIPDAQERDPAATGTLAVLSYTLAYGIGAQRDDATPAAVATICDRLDHLVETIAASGADVALLQDVDFASQRTHDIDQLHYIAAALGWGFVARVMTWECRYLPWPVRQPIGRLRAGMGVMSRYPLVQNMRQRLSQARRVPVLASLFSPYHIVQMVDVQCGTQTIRLFNVGLEAHDSIVRQRQAQELAEFVHQVATPASVLMGAFNAPLPDGPGESREPGARSDQTMRIILDALHGRFRLAAADRVSAPPTASRGLLSHILVGSGVRAIETRVMPLAAADGASGPVVVELRWALPLVVNNGSRHHERL